MTKSYENIDQSTCDTFTLEFRLGKYKKMYPQIQTGEKSFMIKNLGYVEKVKNACEEATEYYNEYNNMYTHEFPESVEKTKNDFNFHYEKSIKKLVTRLSSISSEFVERSLTNGMTSSSSQTVKSNEEPEQSPNSEFVKQKMENQTLKHKVDKLENSHPNQPVQRQGYREILTKNQQGENYCGCSTDIDLYTQLQNDVTFGEYPEGSLDPISEHQSQENESFFYSIPLWVETENSSNDGIKQHSS